MKRQIWNRMGWITTMAAMAVTAMTGCGMEQNGESGMAGKKAVMVYADPVDEEVAAEIGLELPVNDGSTYYEMMAVGLP